MKVAWGHTRLAADLGRSPRAPAVAIGSFDGVHRGHQALLAAARADADTRGAEAGALTFDPHPARYFAPALAPPLIQPLQRRLELLLQSGADFVVVERFDAGLARLTPEEFVDQVLVSGLGVAHVVVGHDFSFGKARAGSSATLTELGRQRGFAVTIIPPVTADGLVCSSTKIREFLLEGRIEGARLLLGRAPEVTGQVVRGAGRGRALGIPTANLDVEGDFPVRTGIYAAWAELLDRGNARYPAAVSVGTNPTFSTGSERSPVTVEPYLLDYPGDDLYGTRVRLELQARLRDEQRFDTVESLLDRDPPGCGPYPPGAGPAGMTSSMTKAPMRQTEHELYETETMAELCARQGRLQEAVAIYRRLLDTHAGDDRLREGRWSERLSTLEHAWGHSAGEEIEPEPIPLPRPPGVNVAASDDSVTVAWALAGAAAAPALELFLIQRTPSGVETSKRTLTLPGPSGRVAFAVPALHSALAAVGRHHNDRFIPIARSMRR